MTVPHEYLSTGCLHGRHDYCSNPTGAVGAKAPAQCKFCSAKCLCPCHQPGGEDAVGAVDENEAERRRTIKFFRDYLLALMGMVCFAAGLLLGMMVVAFEAPVSVVIPVMLALYLAYLAVVSRRYRR